MGERILLVTQPWHRIHSPSLGLGMLKAVLCREGLGCDVVHLNLKLAERIGVRLYTKIASQRFQEGERLFSPYVSYEGKLDAPPDYRRRSWLKKLPPSLRDSFVSHEDYDFIHRCIYAFLEDCLQSVPWEQYDIVGFTSVFEQNLACLALSKLVKLRWPDRVILLGGANCDGEMGLALHQQFPWIDYVVVGEAETIIAPLVRAIRAEKDVHSIPGVVCRDGARSHWTGVNPPILEMDGLPFPHYEDYYRQLQASSLDLVPDVYFESSRGCWWGQKFLCTFCGLNQNSLTYRSKSARRVLSEIRHLLETYPAVELKAADNILPHHYFRDLIPMLAELAREVDFRIFYECKSNLRKGQIRALFRAGIRAIQPGIESFSDRVLDLMDKGATGIQQMQALKWMTEIGIAISYGILYLVPGEKVEDYEQMAKALPFLLHLPPPEYCVPMGLHRFSPFYEQAEQFGIRKIRPHKMYRGIYPFSEEIVARLAYVFDYNYEEFFSPQLALQHESLRKLVSQWQASYRPRQLIYRRSGGDVVIEDRRRGGERTHRLSGLEAELYLDCDRHRSVEKLVRDHSARASEAAVRQILDAFVDRQLAYRDVKGRILGLAVCERQIRTDSDRYISESVACRQGP